MNTNLNLKNINYENILKQYNELEESSEYTSSLFSSSEMLGGKGKKGKGKNKKMKKSKKSKKSKKTKKNKKDDDGDSDSDSDSDMFKDLDESDNGMSDSDSDDTSAMKKKLRKISKKKLSNRLIPDEDSEMTNSDETTDSDNENVENKYKSFLSYFGLNLSDSDSSGGAASKKKKTPKKKGDKKTSSSSKKSSKKTSKSSTKSSKKSAKSSTKSSKKSDKSSTKSSKKSGKSPKSPKSDKSSKKSDKSPKSDKSSKKSGKSPKSDKSSKKTKKNKLSLASLVDTDTLNTVTSLANMDTDAKMAALSSTSESLGIRTPKKILSKVNEAINEITDDSTVTIPDMLSSTPAKRIRDTTNNVKVFTTKVSNTENDTQLSLSLDDSVNSLTNPEEVNRLIKKLINRKGEIAADQTRNELEKQANLAAESAKQTAINELMSDLQKNESTSRKYFSDIDTEMMGGINETFFTPNIISGGAESDENVDDETSSEIQRETATENLSATSAENKLPPETQAETRDPETTENNLLKTEELSTTSEDESSDESNKKYNSMGEEFYTTTVFEEDSPSQGFLNDIAHGAQKLAKYIKKSLS